MICAKVAHTVRSGDLIEHHTQSYQGCSLNCDASAGMGEDVFFSFVFFFVFFPRRGEINQTSFTAESAGEEYVWLLVCIKCAKFRMDTTSSDLSNSTSRIR
jgi:hypothetical protein